MTFTRSTLVFLVCAVAAWPACHLSPGTARDDTALAGFDASTRRVILGDDERALTATLREIGAEASVNIYTAVRKELGRHPADDETVLLPAMDRIAAVLAREYLLPEYARDATYLAGLPRDDRRDMAARLRQLAIAFGEGANDPEASRDSLIRDLDYFRQRDYAFGVVGAERDLAANAIKRGKTDESRRWFAEALADARRAELRIAMCNALSSLAMHDVSKSDADVAVRLDEALQIARESRLAGHAGRAYAIAGVHAHQVGRFGQSCDYLEEAVSVCRDLGQAALGLPYLVMLARFYAIIHDWNRVEALLEHARVLVTEARAGVAAGLSDDPVRVRREELRIEELHARAMLGQGRVAEAEAIYPSLLTATEKLPFEETAYVHDFRSRGLLAAGYPKLALAAAHEAVAYAEYVPLPEMLVRFRLYEATASLACGDTAAARDALAQYATGAARHAGWVDDLRLSACVLASRLAVERPDSAAAALVRGLGLVVDDLEHSDASARAYIDIDRAEELRCALHGLLANDTSAGYGLELMWQRLPGWLGGRDVAAPRSPAELRREIGVLARDARAQLRAADAVHLVYSPQGERVLRWTASGDGVACDTLGVSVDMLANQIAGALALMSRDPGNARAPVSPELVARARDLAEVLLPSDLLAADTTPRVVLVSAFGALALLPFAALDVDTPPRYVPLVERCDVASVRGCGPLTATGAPRSSLVVAAPDLAPRLRRRYPGLAELAGSSAEATHVATLLPHARTLQGAAASLTALRAVWEDVDCLYFACHTVRSPEAPYRTFLPLSPDTDSGIASASGVLDVTDIRATDLTRVRLAVLASCASGAPYVSGQTTAPSLGDAFVDAGAEAVLVTLWRVRDDEPATLLDTCLRGWLQEGLPLPAAMGRSQRQALRGPDGSMRNPFSWAAYTLSLRSPGLASR